MRFVFSFVRVRAIFLTHGLGQLPLVCILVPRVQLWHGFPFKNILLNSPYDLNKFKFAFLNKIYKIYYRVRIYLSYTYLITSDSILGRRLATSFGYGDRKVLFFGSPSQEIAESAIRESNTNSFRILYLPTWRDGSDNIKHILSEIKSVFESNFLTENNIDFIIKLHPYELKRIEVEQFENANIKFIDSDVDDMVGFYLGFDCLITDYSSACFEFAPVSNNVIFYTPDIDAYIYNRGFDNHMSEMIKITGIRNIHDLRDAILQLYNGEKYFALDYFSYVGSSKGCMESIYAKFR
ncbi:CDP-glycerol glycerophosphotransferase family protein [Escherichia coli]|nr:CDP-glycerol glycerophosphotransferase family protein [Escherichia coli]